jgi:hypothetical protein
MALVKGGGDRGAYLDIACIPDSTFATEIAALITAGTQVTGKLVSLTFAANYQVTSPADGAIPDGKIVHYEEAASSTYRLTVRLFSYIDQNSARHTPVCIINLAYSGTLALQDSVIINGTTYVNVDDGTSGGWGAVIGLDVPASGRADVLF